MKRLHKEKKEGPGGTSAASIRKKKGAKPTSYVVWASFRSERPTGGGGKGHDGETGSGQINNQGVKLHEKTQKNSQSWQQKGRF